MSLASRLFCSILFCSALATGEKESQTCTCFTRRNTEHGTRNTEHGTNTLHLYACRLPYDPTKRPYHTLVAVGPPPEERIVGFVTLRMCSATSPFGAAGALMPVIVIDLIATDPSIRGGGLGGALLKLAIAACFERGRGRPHGGYLLTEAVSTGPGWKFWQSRVTRKDPLAISLAIQLICGVSHGVLTELALPCGTLLFPEPPPSADA